MQCSLVFTVIGPDRPGLIECIAGVVTDHEGSWLESRMARLAGRFAGVLRVQVPRENAEALAAALEALRSQGLSTVIERIDTEAPSQETRRLDLELLGHDRPGIVRDISRLLAQRGVNVVELRTECFSAAMSGDPMFRAVAELRSPRELEVDDLAERLEDAGRQLGVDITLQERHGTEGNQAGPSGV